MENLEMIKNNLDINRDRINWSCNNANNSTENYSNFLTKLAGIAIGLSPLIFFGNYISIGFAIKVIFTASIISIFGSIFFGAVYIVKERKFYEKWTEHYLAIYSKWNKALLDEIKPEEVQAYEDGIYGSEKTNSSLWPLFVQGVLVFLGFLGYIVIIIYKVF